MTITKEHATQYGDYLGDASGYGNCSHCNTYFDNNNQHPGIGNRVGCSHEHATLCDNCSYEVDQIIHPFKPYHV